ncbi:unnamed protein product [Pleuronectes platessa]|uniref:Microtubule-associated protein n=1 Tax=Pleuronectes platessa TaxID=8262 RepID=A0A9N7UM40_PLEPL|nr:unnamed protein product [Pleuronectes platessa]
MSFLSGSPWQKPGVISGSSGYGQPSSGHQRQLQQQHVSHNVLSGANVPAVLASPPLSPSSPASGQPSDWHCHGQMALGGQIAVVTTQMGPIVTSTEDEVTLGRCRIEGTTAKVASTQSVDMPSLKIEDEEPRLGRRTEDGHTSGEAAAVMATMMSSQLMTSPVLPSSPPPKRHHGSCETNFLLAVPPPAVKSNQESKLETLVKSDNKDKQPKMDIMSTKTDKTESFDKKEKEEQQKKDNVPDKNQKSEKILKDEEKAEKMNVEKNKANEKSEKVDKPEKTNKDEKKEEEKKLAEKKEEKGGKGTAKSPNSNGSKTLPSSDSKSKTPDNGTAEKRPPVPKATTTPRAAANKNGSSATPASKAAVNKNEKAESKTGEAKKPKTTARPRPASNTTPATPAASINGDNASHRRRVLTKPPVPKQVPMEKKPPVPRANRTPRPLNAPDLKNVRSKIGSIDNIKYQPGGGRVSSTQNNKTSDPCTPVAKARVQILSKKVDVSKVTSKLGSKDNIKYKPGGGDVKIEAHKPNIKAKSKIGSLDNVGPGNGQTNGHKEEKAEEKTSSPPSGAPATGPAGVAKATAPGGVAKENGAKEPTPSPFGGDGLREPLTMDKRITETN